MTLELTVLLQCLNGKIVYLKKKTHLGILDFQLRDCE